MLQRRITQVVTVGVFAVAAFWQCKKNSFHDLFY